ncbi:MAG: Na+/H+ antiporter subunit G [Alphaproteobacteria bacterium]|nr:Na+/H+ antiporter subunit G [Alphaproteobacteria bacterium]
MLLMAELVIAAFILGGAFFLLVGSFGLAKLPDTMRRLHGPTKSTTLGIGCLLIASMIHFLAERGAPSVHELLITLFLFLTAPVSAHMIAKAHILLDRPARRALPDTGQGDGWATLAAPSRTAGETAGRTRQRAV